MILPADITGVDDGTARRVLVYARSIAPTLDLLEGEDRLNAIAILHGIAIEIVGRGSRMIASQRIGSAAVSYREVASFFSADDRSALRSLCVSQSSGLPVGAFPPADAIGGLWPEVPYS